MIQSRCGFVAIVGRPNVGKSTLINNLLGKKVSITSRRQHTTRHKIMGVKTSHGTQTIYVDTPGIDKVAMDVDCVIFLVDRIRWTDEDQVVLEWLRCVNAPVILAVNKVDLLNNKALLLPWLEHLAYKCKFEEIMPLSAKKGINIERLDKIVTRHLPVGQHLFPKDQITDKSQSFIAAELVREKAMRKLGDELPYQVTVEIEEFRNDGLVIHIGVLMLVERKGQKTILIGDHGARVKSIGRDARIEMERVFSTPVMLKLWVKVKG